MSGEFERLSPSTVSRVGIAVKIRLLAVVIGLVGVCAAGWSMRNSAESAEAAGRLGLQRVESNMENILGLLALPVLLFFVILTAWGLVDLLRLYRVANDPNRFRGKRRRR